MFNKVQQVRAFESVIRQVENAILQGNLSTGDRLPSERDLQETLGVSRNTLRESLRVLEQKGLIEIRKGSRGGIFVKEINADSMTESLGLFVQSRRITLDDISEFRQDLEGLIARRAALRSTPKKIGPVNHLIRQAERLAEKGAAEWDAFMQADKEIHLALAQLAGNPLHHFFLETVHNNLHHYHIAAYLPRDAKTIQTNLGELKEIVAAVSRGDADRAEALSREHVGQATESMKKVSAVLDAKSPQTTSSKERNR